MSEAKTSEHSATDPHAGDAAGEHAAGGEDVEGQSHPIGIYLKIWAWLFVLSALSYLVEIADFQGLLRWGLVTGFMMLKAGLIVAVFMHMMWERLALIYAILVPTLAIVVFVLLMAFEGDYVEGTRLLFFQ